MRTALNKFKYCIDNNTILRLFPLITDSQAANVILYYHRVSKDTGTVGFKLSFIKQV